MRFTHALVSRPDWYDRNPVAIRNTFFSSAVAPHVDTQRWAYTVPAAKKAAIQNINTQTVRDVAATTAGQADAFIQYTPSGGAVATLLSTRFISVTVDTGKINSMGGNMTILTGDLLQGRTQDASTGGSVFYNEGFQGLEFDA
jgi:hypothetical protein